MSEHNQPVVIIGNVGKDPVMDYTAAGSARTHVNVAVHAGKDKEGNKLTAWYKVTFWNELAEAVNETVKKGARLCIGGQPEAPIKVWKDKSGAYQASYVLTGYTCDLLTRDYIVKAVIAPKDEISTPTG